MAKKQVEAAPDSGVSPEQALSNLEKVALIGKPMAKLLRMVGTGGSKMPGSEYAEAIKQQLRTAGGVAPRKKGGKISKGKSKSKKPRGVGAAQRGYGKALTGRKK